MELLFCIAGMLTLAGVMSYLVGMAWMWFGIAGVASVILYLDYRSEERTKEKSSSSKEKKDTLYNSKSKEVSKYYEIYKKSQECEKNISNQKLNTVRTIMCFNKNEIYAIYDVSLALCCLATNAGDSWVSAVLQDENIDKGWKCLMRISATIDNWKLKQKGITNLHCIDSYRKMEVPEDISQFLASIPFDVNGGTLTYDFQGFPQWPSSCAAGIIASMEKGSKMSRYASVRDVKIEKKSFGVQCKVD